MKRLLPIILSTVMALSVCACGGGAKPTETTTAVVETTVEKAEDKQDIFSKEELLAKAVEIGDYESDMKDNPLRAEEKYKNQPFLITGYVSNITTENVKVGGFTVALPKEEIMKLDNGQKITIVGIIDSLSETETSELAFGSEWKQTEYGGSVSNGFVVDDKFELSGILTFYYMGLMDIDGKNHDRTGEADAWTIGLDMKDDSFIKVDYSMKEDIPIEHQKGKDITTVTISETELHNKDKITVSAKVFSDGHLEDVELVSVG